MYFYELIVKITNFNWKSVTQLHKKYDILRDKSDEEKEKPTHWKSTKHYWDKLKETKINKEI